MKRKVIAPVLISILLLALFAWARPTFTPALERAGSVTSLEKIELGGMEQWIQIRAQDASNPVLLWLHGGPGAAQMSVARHFNGALEEHFVVVHWDQRGAGKSNPIDFDASSMTFNQYLNDAHELTLYLKERFGQDKIYLVGHSWGSQLGIHLVRMYPQDYYAYVGVSQVVNSVRAQEIGYDWLEKQVATVDERTDLGMLGQPPFRGHDRFVRYIQWIDRYGGVFDVSFAELAWVTFRSPEYNLRDAFHWLRGSTRGSGPMWESPEYQEFDALRDIPRLEIPVYFFSGRRDYNTPLVLVEAYFEVLDAPRGKQLVVFDASAHTPFIGQPQKFNEELVRVKHETYPR
ncbi:MAG TPA: alpha/beta hydrolase [Anaerolineales bacterium]|nr:alpha/beta hydrolase [Anaerolineales bacterium]